MSDHPHSHPSPSLEDRVRSLELELTASRAALRRPSGPRRGVRRSFTVLATIIAVVVLPMVAFASDAFTDIPDDHAFHDQISEVFDARITNGCTATTYCPLQTVNRQQMAAFMSRGLPRAAAFEDFTVITADTAALLDVATVTIPTGGVTGGTGYVIVTGTLGAFTTSGTTCPCEVGMLVRNTGSGDTPIAQFFDVQNTPMPSGFRDGMGTMSWVFEVATGTSATFALSTTVDMTGGASPSLTLVGQVTAVYVPFGTAGFPGLAADGEAIDRGRAD